MAIFPWVSEPPPGTPLTRQFHRVRGLKGPGPMWVTLLDDDIKCAMLHFDGVMSRTRVCQLDKCDCVQTGQRRRLYGFTPAREAKTNDLFALELTEAAIHQLAAIRLQHGRLRGAMIRLTRKASHRNAMVVVDLADFADPRNIPEPFDVVPLLERLWGIQMRELQLPKQGGTP